MGASHPLPLEFPGVSGATRVPSEVPLTSCGHLSLPEFVINVLFSVCAVTCHRGWKCGHVVYKVVPHPPSYQIFTLSWEAVETDAVGPVIDGETDTQREKMTLPGP